MNVVITGGCGFLGRLIAEKLVGRGDAVTLFDMMAPPDGLGPLDGKDRVVAGDISDKATVENVIAGAEAVIHLASMVSAGSEADFDAAMRVNIDGGRYVLDACRAQGPKTKVLFSSSLAIFGGAAMPARVDGMTRPVPQNTYGMTKVVVEMLLNDMSRKGFIDGRAARFPTVIVRPGKPNAAASSFASGMFREPLAGVECRLPVPRDMRLVLGGYRTVVDNVIRFLDLPADKLGDDRVLNFPNLTASVAEMASSLQAVAKRRGIALGPIVDAPDARIAGIVGSWPAEMDASRALALGLVADAGLERIVEEYVDDFVR